jgi:rubrerythrin
MFTGVYWADGETAAETPPRILSHHRCAKCGYSIRVEWRACPNCGKATEFA